MKILALITGLLGAVASASDAEICQTSFKEVWNNDQILDRFEQHFPTVLAPILEELQRTADDPTTPLAMQVPDEWQRIKLSAPSGVSEDYFVELTTYLQTHRSIDWWPHEAAGQSWNQLFILIDDGVIHLRRLSPDSYELYDSRKEGLVPSVPIVIDEHSISFRLRVSGKHFQIRFPRADANESHFDLIITSLIRLRLLSVMGLTSEWLDQPEVLKAAWNFFGVEQLPLPRFFDHELNDIELSRLLIAMFGTDQLPPMYDVFVRRKKMNQIAKQDLIVFHFLEAIQKRPASERSAVENRLITLFNQAMTEVKTQEKRWRRLVNNDLNLDFGTSLLAESSSSSDEHIVKQLTRLSPKELEIFIGESEKYFLKVKTWAFVVKLMESVQFDHPALEETKNWIIEIEKAWLTHKVTVDAILKAKVIPATSDIKTSTELLDAVDQHYPYYLKALTGALLRRGSSDTEAHAVELPTEFGDVVAVHSTKQERLLVDLLTHQSKSYSTISQTILVDHLDDIFTLFYLNTAELRKVGERHYRFYTTDQHELGVHPLAFEFFLKEDHVEVQLHPNVQHQPQTMTLRLPIDQAGDDDFELITRATTKILLLINLAKVKGRETDQIIDNLSRAWNPFMLQSIPAPAWVPRDFSEAFYHELEELIYDGNTQDRRMVGFFASRKQLDRFAMLDVMLHGKIIAILTQQDRNAQEEWFRRLSATIERSAKAEKDALKAWRKLVKNQLFLSFDHPSDFFNSSQWKSSDFETLRACQQRDSSVLVQLTDGYLSKALEYSWWVYFPSLFDSMKLMPLEESTHTDAQEKQMGGLREARGNLHRILQLIKRETLPPEIVTAPLVQTPTEPEVTITEEIPVKKSSLSELLEQLLHTEMDHTTSLRALFEIPQWTEAEKEVLVELTLAQTRVDNQMLLIHFILSRIDLRWLMVKHTALSIFALGLPLSFLEEHLHLFAKIDARHWLLVARQIHVLRPDLSQLPALEMSPLEERRWLLSFGRLTPDEKRDAEELLKYVDSRVASLVSTLIHAESAPAKPLPAAVETGESEENLIETPAKIEDQPPPIHFPALQDEPSSQTSSRRTSERVVRDLQTPFRRALIKAYPDGCPISGVKDRDLLSSSHLLPEGLGRFTYHESCGILLNELLHRLLDKQRMDIHPQTGEIQFAKNLSEPSILAYAGRRIDVHRINPVALETRHLAFRFAEWFRLSQDQVPADLHEEISRHLVNHPQYLIMTVHSPEMKSFLEAWRFPMPSDAWTGEELQTLSAALMNSRQVAERLRARELTAEQRSDLQHLNAQIRRSLRIGVLKSNSRTIVIEAQHKLERQDVDYDLSDYIQLPSGEVAASSSFIDLITFEATHRFLDELESSDAELRYVNHLKTLSSDPATFIHGLLGEGEFTVVRSQQVSGE